MHHILVQIDASDLAVGVLGFDVEFDQLEYLVVQYNIIPSKKTQMTIDLEEAHHRIIVEGMDDIPDELRNDIFFNSYLLKLFE